MGQQLTLRDARDQYFETTGFTEASYQDTWLKLPIGRFNVYLPSPPSRRRCIARHDLHHVLTGYGTNWVGEFEMSAWEVGAGCGNYWFAWMINTQSVMVGAIPYWSKLLTAFSRGRRSRSLYHEPTIDNLLDRPIDELRARLELAPDDVEPTTRERVAFAVYVLTPWVLALGLGAAAIALAAKLLF